MSTFGNIELSNPTGEFKTDETAKMTLLNNTPSDVDLHVLDKKGLNELKDTVANELDNINQNNKDEIEQGNDTTLKAAKDHTDQRLKVFAQNLAARDKELDKSLRGMVKGISDVSENVNEVASDLNDLVDNVGKLDAGIEVRIENKLMGAVIGVEDKINANKVLIDANQVNIEQLRNDVDFNMNGTLKLAGMLTDKTSTDVLGEADKDAFLTQYIKDNGFPRGPKNGYFIRCKDEICFFYVEGKWYQSKAAGQSFSVTTPITYTNGAIGLKIAPDTGLSTGAEGLTFSPDNVAAFDKYVKKDGSETITGAWTFEQAITSKLDATDDQHLTTLKQVKTIVDEEIKKVPTISVTGQAPIVVSNNNEISLEIENTSGLEITGGKLTFDATKTNQFENLTNKTEDEVITGDWKFTNNLTITTDATDNKHVPTWKQVQDKIKESVDAIDVKTYSGTGAIKIENDEISLKIKTDGGLILENNELAVDALNLDINSITDADKLTRKDQDETVTGNWTFNEGLTLVKEADEDMQVPTWKQVQDHVKTKVDAVPGTTYSGEGAIEITVDNKIKLNVKDGSGLKIEGDELTFEITGNTSVAELAKKSEVDAEFVKVRAEFATADTKVLEAAKADTDAKLKVIADALAENDQKLDVALKDMVSDIKETETKIEAKVNEKVTELKNEIEPKIELVNRKAENNAVDISRIYKELEVISNGAMKLVGLLEESSSDVDTEQGKNDQWLTDKVREITSTEPRNGYFVRTKDEVAYYYINRKWVKGKVSNQTGKGDLNKDDDFTIHGNWTFEEPIKSDKNATDDKHLPNLKQVNEIVNTKFNTIPTQGAYTAGDGVEITADSKIKVKLANDSGLTLSADGLALDANNANVNIKVTGQAPIVVGQDNAISLDIDETSGLKIKDNKLSFELANTGQNPTLEEFEQAIEKGKEEVNQAVVDAKAEINKQTADQIAGMQAIITQGSNVLTSGKEEIEKLGTEKLEAINTAFDTQKAEIDEKLHGGDAYIQNLLADSADKMNAYVKEKNEELDTIGKTNMGSIEDLSTKKRAEITKTTDEVLDKIRKASPCLRKINTFKTGAKSTRLSGIVYQEVWVNDLNEIQKYGDIIFRGQQMDGFIGGSGETNGWFRLFAPSYVEIDYYMVSHRSIFLRPKKGQMDPDDGKSLDNAIYVYGLNGNGQLGVGDTTIRYLPTKVEFPARVKEFRSGGYCDGSWTNMALLENGELYVCGLNYKGELGLGHASQVNTWTKSHIDTATLGEIIDIDTASLRAVFVTHKVSDNEYKVSACGENLCGFFGIGEFKDLHTYTEISNHLPHSLVEKPEVKSCSDYYSRGYRSMLCIRRGDRIYHTGTDLYHVSTPGNVKDFQELGVQLHRERDDQFWVNPVMIAAIGTYNGVFGIHTFGYTEDLIQQQNERYHKLDTTIIDQHLINDDWKFLYRSYQHNDETRPCFCLIYNETQKRLYIVGQHSLNNTAYTTIRRRPLEEVDLPSAIRTAKNVEFLVSYYGRLNNMAIFILADNEIYGCPIMGTNLYNRGLVTNTQNSHFNLMKD